MDNSIVWETHEYTFRPNGTDWYWAVGIITVAIAIVAILLGNLLFAVFIIIAAFTLALHAAKPPQFMEYEINPKGVRVGKYFYPYVSLESFWIDEHGEPKILVRSKKTFMPYIVMPIADLDHNALREILLQYLPEVEHYEPLSQKIMEYLGF